MPAHNEADYLRPAVEAVVGGLRLRGEPFEVIIVENGSTDLTIEVGRALTAEMNEVRMLDLPGADYGRALRAGFLAATGVTVVNFDVDFVDLGFYDAAGKVLEREGATVVVGSKRSPGAADGRNGARRAITLIFSLVLRHGFGLKVSDTHGLKLLDRSALAGVVAACEFGGDIFDTELVLRAERSGLLVTEVPVEVADQRPPRTPIARRIPRSLWGLVRLRVRLWRAAPT